MEGVGVLGRDDVGVDAVGRVQEPELPAEAGVGDARELAGHELAHDLPRGGIAHHALRDRELLVEVLEGGELTAKHVLEEGEVAVREHQVGRTPVAEHLSPEPVHGGTVLEAGLQLAPEAPVVEIEAGGGQG
jgi:hypothetical protein